MKILKYIAVALATMMIMINFTQPVAEATTFDVMSKNIKDWMANGQKFAKERGSVNSKAMGEILKPIVGILTAIGVIALIVITMIMGIKYMFATPEEAAKLKQQLIGLVVSAVVVLGATAIWKIIYNILVASKL